MDSWVTKFYANLSVLKCEDCTQIKGKQNMGKLNKEKSNKGKPNKG